MGAVVEEDPSDCSLPFRVSQIIEKSKSFVELVRASQMGGRTTYLSRAQGCVHGVKTKRSKPGRIKSTISLEFVYFLDQGVKRTTSVLVSSDEVRLALVWPDLGFKTSDDAEIVASAPHSPPKVRVTLFVHANA